MQTLKVYVFYRVIFLLWGNVAYMFRKKHFIFIMDGTTSRLQLHKKHCGKIGGPGYCRLVEVGENFHLFHVLFCRAVNGRVLNMNV